MVSALLTNGNNDIFIGTRDAKCIRFPEDNVRAMGRSARGVTGMTLSGKDEVVAVEILDKKAEDFEILTVTENGYGKRTPVSDYRLQSRSGKGVISMKVTSRNGRVVAACQVRPEDDVMMMSDKGKMIRMRVGEISEQGRVTQGVRVMSMGPNEKVAALEIIADESVVETDPGNNGSKG